MRCSGSGTALSSTRASMSRMRGRARKTSASFPWMATSLSRMATLLLLLRAPLSPRPGPILGFPARLTQRDEPFASRRHVMSRTRVRIRGKAPSLGPQRWIHEGRPRPHAAKACIHHAEGDTHDHRGVAASAGAVRPSVKGEARSSSGVHPRARGDLATVGGAGAFIKTVPARRRSGHASG
jgi:hypothetical protein